MRPSSLQFPDHAFIEAAITDTRWDLGNEVLYTLCRNYPGHAEPSAVLAKIWLIGRAYAAAIERRIKNLKMDGDDFLELLVASEMKRVDPWFE